MPRAGLDRRAVVDLAVRVVDERGLEGLTLAAVAAGPGVAVPSLYKHVASLADLREAVAAEALVALRRRIDDEVGPATGAEALRRFGRAVRAFATERPGMYAATQVVADQGGEAAATATAIIDGVGRLLRGLGLPGEREVDGVRAIRAAIHGFVVLERERGFGMPDDRDASFEALLDIVIAGFAALGPAR